MITFDDVFTTEHIFHQYHVAIRGKRGHTKIIKYHQQCLSRLYKLRERLFSGEYYPSKDREFIIYEPKKRIIIANSFEDKIVQGNLVEHVLKPLIESRLIYDNYASRPNKGTDVARDRLCEFIHNYYINNGNSADGYILKCDIRKYFYSISIPKLKAMVSKLDIDDKLKELFDIEIRAINEETQLGLRIGHEISQWLAIYYLNEMDHYIKEKLHIKYYGRYMDDFYLIHKDKDYLIHCRNEINRILSELGLELNEKTKLLNMRQGMDFIGFHFDLTDTGKVKQILLRKSIKRMRHYIKAVKPFIEENNDLIYELLDGLTSWKAHAVKGCSKNVIYEIDILFYNLYYDIMVKNDIYFINYCYIPGKYERGKSVKFKDFMKFVRFYGDPPNPPLTLQGLWNIKWTSDIPNNTNRNNGNH